MNAIERVVTMIVDVKNVIGFYNMLICGPKTQPSMT